MRVRVLYVCMYACVQSEIGTLTKFMKIETDSTDANRFNLQKFNHEKISKKVGQLQVQSQELSKN